MPHIPASLLAFNYRTGDTTTHRHVPDKPLAAASVITVLIDERRYYSRPVAITHRALVTSGPTFNIIKRKDRDIVTGFDAIMPADAFPRAAALRNYNLAVYNYTQPHHDPDRFPATLLLHDAKMRRTGISVANAVSRTRNHADMLLIEKERLPSRKSLQQSIDEANDQLLHPWNYDLKPIDPDMLFHAHYMHNLRLFGQVCLQRFLRCYTVLQENPVTFDFLTQIATPRFLTPSVDEDSFRIIFNRVAASFYLHLSQQTDLTGEYAAYRSRVRAHTDEFELDFDPYKYTALDTPGTCVDQKLREMLDHPPSAERLKDDTAAFISTAWEEAGTFGAYGFMLNPDSDNNQFSKTRAVMPPLFYGADCDIPG